jgi:hypothetical protein
MVVHEAKNDQADYGDEFLSLALIPLSTCESYPDADGNRDASIFDASIFPSPFYAFGDGNEDDDDDLEEDDFDDMEEEEFDDDEDEFDEDEDDDDEDEDDEFDEDDEDYDYDDDDEEFEFDEE